MTATLHRQPLDPGVVRLTLDHPSAANALTDALLDELRETFVELDADPAVRCVLLRGQGGRSFSSGYDTSQLQPGRFRGLPDPIGPVVEAMLASRLPVIGCLNGHVLGGAVEIAAACDIRLGQAGATVGIPAVRFGICYAPAGLARLRDALGAQLAAELLLGGRPVDMELALRAGFLARVCAAEQIDAEAEALARSLATAAPLAVEAMRAVLQGSAPHATHGVAPDSEEARALFAACLGSADLAEGLAALAEQRPAVFQRR